MGPTVDTSDLVDATEVAEILGLAQPNAVSVYRHRYADFSEPVVEKSRCLLWMRGDIGEWGRKTGRLT